MSNDKTFALITGASGGIGLELAKLFATDKYNLILVARSEDKLKSIAEEYSSKYNITVEIIAKDLGKPESSQEVFDIITSKKLDVEFLVNNAGFATQGKFYELPIQGELDEIGLNITALTHLTRLFLPQMVTNKSGKILNVASTAAFQPGPFMATYYATKAYVLFFSEAIANELKGTGVTVTTLCPGPTETGFDKRAGTTDLPLFKMGNMKPDEVARQGYQALMQGKAVIVTGLKNKAMALLPRILPRNLVTNMVRSVQEK